MRSLTHIGPVLLVGSLLCIGGCSSASHTDGLTIEDRAFGGVLLTTDGVPVALRDELAGSYAVLDFWATWCQPCRAWQAPLRQIAENREGDSGLLIVGVAIEDDRGRVAVHVERERMAWRHLVAPGAFEHETVRRLGIDSVPSVYAVFPDGRAVDLHLERLPDFVAESQGIPTDWGIGHNGLRTEEAIVERYGAPDTLTEDAAGRRTLRYVRESPLTEQEFSTMLVFLNGQSIFFWTERRLLDPAILELRFPEEAQRALDRIETALLDERGIEGVTYRRSLALVGTTQGGADYMGPLDVIGGRLPDEPWRGNLLDSDWTRDRRAHMPAGTYELRFSLIPEPQALARGVGVIHDDLGPTYTLVRGRTVRQTLVLDAP